MDPQKMVQIKPSQSFNTFVINRYLQPSCARLAIQRRGYHDFSDPEDHRGLLRCAKVDMRCIAAHVAGKSLPLCVTTRDLGFRQKWVSQRRTRVMFCLCLGESLLLSG
jgi:hypothetical protein